MWLFLFLFIKAEQSRVMWLFLFLFNKAELKQSKAELTRAKAELSRAKQSYVGIYLYPEES
jgi:hypothetical protein